MQYYHPYCWSTKKKVLVIVQCCLVKPALNMVKVLKANESILGPGRQFSDGHIRAGGNSLLLVRPKLTFSTIQLNVWVADSFITNVISLTDLVITLPLYLLLSFLHNSENTLQT